MGKRQFRFQMSDHNWTRWYSDGDDLSFLKNNCEVIAMETSETMTREQAKAYLDQQLSPEGK